MAEVTKILQEVKTGLPSFCIALSALEELFFIDISDVNFFARCNLFYLKVTIKFFWNIFTFTSSVKY